MKLNKKEPLYPDNLILKQRILKSGRSITYYAKQLGVSVVVLNSTVNGHYKGGNIIPKLEQVLNGD